MAHESGRPPQKVRALQVVKSLLKNNMSPLAVSKELGISRQAVHKQMNKNPYVKRALAIYLESLEKAGVTDKMSARVLSEAMRAEKTIHVNCAETEGRVEIRVPDHSIRLRANDQYLKIRFFLKDRSQKNVEVEPHVSRFCDLGEKSNEELCRELKEQLPFFCVSKPNTKEQAIQDKIVSPAN